MKRKFSFDLPRLKFGPSKQETQALKQHLASRRSFDSEPPTPKSVRPPLPHITEAELKAACAWVVANYRPSHIPYVGSSGIGVSAQPAQHVDYAAINAQVRREMAEAASRPVQWPSIPVEEARVDQNGSQWPSSDMFRYKPTETSKDLFHQDEFEAMRQQRSSIMAKADELMANLEETRKVLLTPEVRSHSRSASNQSALSLSLPADDSKAALRCDSMGTFTSTPRTDVTSGAWPDSTPATSAYVTPALQSKRTSHTQSDTYLPPKVSAVDAEWMRLELEKHLKAQEEDLARRESPVKEMAAGLAETTPTQVAETPTSPTSIRRKPVPRRGTGESQNFSKPTEPRHNTTHSRTESHSLSMPSSPLQPNVTEMPAIGQRVSTNDPKRMSLYNGPTQDLGELPRPSTAHTAVRPGAPMHSTRSRAQSVKANVQNFSRPSMDATSRRVSPGPDLSNPARRSRSVDSFQSAVSSISSSEESFNNKPWRYSMMSRRRSHDSDVSLESLGTRVSEASRGRPRAPRRSPPPPPINLDRELPPLPKTEKWAPVPCQMSSPVQSSAAKNESTPEVKSEHRPFPQRKDSLVNRRPAQPLMQSPPDSATAPTFDKRHTVYFDAQSSPLFDRPLAPANTRDPAVSPGLSSESRERHRRSKSVTEAASPELINHMSQVSLGTFGTEQRPLPRQLNSATHIPAEKRHSRNISGGAEATNFSRKFSTDDHARMYDSRYQNMLEVTPSPNQDDEDGLAAGAPVVPTKEKPKAKRHWWQSKPKKEETWMDTVVKSGSRSGVLLTDEVAGAPIVRY